MIHRDLFSGIGGFAYAVDQVWDNVEHIFCDNNKFCQEVLKKHWKGSVIYEDIRDVTYANWYRLQEQRKKQQASGDRQFLETATDAKSGQSGQSSEQERREDTRRGGIDLLTGGFPCQPFSQAGKRRGTSDDRFLWPEMFRVIQEFKPTWVIAENVRGILTIESGMVFEQVCLDLEREGYEVQPFIIPACAVNAPHRRDRVWIVANRNDTGSRTQQNGFDGNREEKNKGREKQPFNRINGQRSNAPDAIGTNCGGKDNADLQNQRGETRNNRREGLQSHNRKTCSDNIEQRDFNASDTKSGEPGKSTKREGWENFERRNWEINWLEVATKLCRVDDGLPAELDGFKLTKAGHRVERLKALGNAIVPQVAIEIMKAIKYAEEN